jgi:two-component system alkaline phosphatase synthesis response regulator PhoP
MAEPLKVMLVEDDIALRDIYQTRLGAEGFDVSVVADGEEALTEALRVRPHLILLDLMMPKINGFDVLDILKKTGETKDTKVIVLSALSDENSQARAKELGADEYVVKSQVSLSDVVDKIHRHLAHI